MLYPYPGYSPKNVSKDAKYSVVRNEHGVMAVRLIYRASAREKWLLTTDQHEKLVTMVNDAKLTLSGSPGGIFYVNEFGHVLVPHPVGSGCAYVGTYRELLKFDYNGQPLSLIAPSHLMPGQHWAGPRVGIPYIVAAGGNDIKYQAVTGPRSYEHRLSDYAGAAAAQSLARRLSKIKGLSGGRFYINEAREMFTPPSALGGEHIYLGGLGDDLWFPAPELPVQV